MMTKKRNRKKNSRQVQLAFHRMERPKESFGGSLLKKGNPRHARPLSFKRPIHVVLRSSQAVGEKSLLRKVNADIVRKALKFVKRRYGVRVYEFANAGNHLHLAVQVRNQRQWRGFIRSLTTRIAMQVSGSRKGHAAKTGFWDFRPWTRLADWGRAYQILKDYVVLNYLEANRVVPVGNRTLARVMIHSWERGDPRPKLA